MTPASPLRRLWLKAALPTVTISVAAAAGLLTPRIVWARAGDRPLDLLRKLRGAQAALSEHVHVGAPDIAEDGASVFLEIRTDLPDVDGLVLFAENNPQQLIAAFWLAPEVLPDLKTRIKLAVTSRVWVVARSQGQFYKNQKLVKVTVGGCGVGQN